MTEHEQTRFFYETFDASLPRLGPGDDAILSTLVVPLIASIAHTTIPGGHALACGEPGPADGPLERPTGKDLLVKIIPMKCFRCPSSVLTWWTRYPELVGKGEAVSVAGSTRLQRRNTADLVLGRPACYRYRWGSIVGEATAWETIMARQEQLRPE